MYIASMNFGKYRIGDEVPEDLPNNAERLARGLIREVKVINPTETKAKSNVSKRKPKNKTKSDK